MIDEISGDEFHGTHIIRNARLCGFRKVDLPRLPKDRALRLHRVDTVQGSQDRENKPGIVLLIGKRLRKRSPKHIQIVSIVGHKNFIRSHNFSGGLRLSLAAFSAYDQPVEVWFLQVLQNES
jgi:hypothetical protein